MEGESMSEWKEVRLGDVSTINAGGDAPRGNMSKVKNEKFFIPIYSNGIDNQGLYGFTNKAIIERPACTITARGTIGVVFNRKEPYYPIVRLISVIADESIIKNDFLYYLLRNTRIKGDGSVQEQFTIPMAKDIHLKIPTSIENQDHITGILSSLDAKIETNNKLNEKLEEMAQAIFKSWLDGCDETVQIDDLSLNITDYSKLNKDKVILINSSDVTNGFFDHHNYSDNNKLKGHFKKRFSKGDILYSQVRPRNRHWAYCYFDAEDYIASTQLMVIRNNPEKVSSLLLYQYLISDRVWNEFTLKTETRSGTFPQGNYEDLSKICVPYKKDNEKISKTLEHIYNIIYNRYDENQRLASLRDTLLPRLMSGELTV